MRTIYHAYKAEDGTLHETPEGAREADVLHYTGVLIAAMSKGSPLSIAKELRKYNSPGRIAIKALAQLEYEYPITNDDLESL